MQDALTRAVKALVEHDELHQVDSVLGRYLVALPAWTAAQGRAAMKMVAKYVSRLRAYGISAADLQSVLGGDSALRVRGGSRLAPNSHCRVSADSKSFTVRFRYSPELQEAVRLLPQARWDDRAGFWRVPLTLPAAERLYEFAHVHGFEIEAGVFSTVLDRMTRGAEKAARASRSQAADYEVPGVLRTLRPYQQAGVRYGVEVARGRMLLCDEMGLGKTVEALAIVQKMEAWPLLVVCPASLKYNWQIEARAVLGIEAEVLPDAALADLLMPIKKSKALEFKGKILIINYDILGGAVEELRRVKWGAVILDESHYLKDGKAQRTQAAKKVVRGVPVRLALTGTPVVNGIVDFVSQLSLIGQLDALGGFWPFVERYCQARKVQFSRAKWGWDLSGRANARELHERLRATCFLRRRKKDVLTELPDKTRATVPIALDNWDEYRRAEEDMVQWLATRAASDQEFLATLADLPETERSARIEARHLEKVEQLADCEALVRFEALKQLSVKGKMAAAKAWVENFLQGGEKLVLFAEHIEAVKGIAAHFNAPALMGDTPSKKRQEMVERFQNDPECRLLVCNLKAGGVGITLTAASNVAFLEQGWTAAVMDQAEDREHRYGQTLPVTCYYLMGKGTVDWQIYGIVRGKRALCAVVVDGEGNEAAGRSQTLRELVREFLEPKML